METLERIILETDEDEYSISTSIIRARTFSGAEKKLKRSRCSSDHQNI